MPDLLLCMLPCVRGLLCGCVAHHQEMTAPQLSREKSDTKRVLQYYEKHFTKLYGRAPSRIDKVRFVQLVDINAQNAA